MKELSPKSRQESILRALLNKYQADPGGFHSYLPEVAQQLDKLFSAQIRGDSRSAVTELERERLHKALFGLLEKKELAPKEAIQALEYCATLVQGGSLPSQLSRKTLLHLLHQAAGVSLSKVRKTIKLPVDEGEAIKEVALLRGVHLNLTWKDRLVAISILPTRVKERSKAMRFVGVAKDAASDVAQHHDAYLAEGLSNAIG